LALVIHGADYQWYIRYPGADQLLFTADDQIARQNMTVPRSTRLHLTLTSRDYLYTFRVPELGQKQMAVPELFFKLEFHSGDPGHFTLKGDQMCGFAHETLIGDFKVVEAAEYRAWLKTLKPPSAYPEAPELINPPKEATDSMK